MVIRERISGANLIGLASMPIAGPSPLPAISSRSQQRWRRTVGACASGEGGSARARPLLFGRDREERGEGREERGEGREKREGRIEAAAAGREARERAAASLGRWALVGLRVREGFLFIYFEMHF
jgi:hypothetical protein